MIFVNLLPDIKIEFIKAQRLRRVITIVSILMITLCVTLCGWLWQITEGSQKDSITKLRADLDTEFAELEQNDEISRILDIQNQLQVLTPLHEEKIEAWRLIDKPAEIIYKIFDKDKNSGSAAKNPDSELVSYQFDFKENTFSVSFKTKNVASLRRLNASFQLAGKGDCTPTNRTDRLLFFYIPEVPVWQSSISTSEDDSEDGDGERMTSFTISGQFQPNMFARDVALANIDITIPDSAISSAEKGQPDPRCGHNYKELFEKTPIPILDVE